MSSPVVVLIPTMLHLPMAAHITHHSRGHILLIHILDMGQIIPPLPRVHMPLSRVHVPVPRIPSVTMVLAVVVSKLAWPRGCIGVDLCSNVRVFRFLNHIDLVLQGAWLGAWDIGHYPMVLREIFILLIPATRTTGSIWTSSHMAVSKSSDLGS